MSITVVDRYMMIRSAVIKEHVALTEGEVQTIALSLTSSEAITCLAEAIRNFES